MSKLTGDHLGMPKAVLKVEPGAPVRINFYGHMRMMFNTWLGARQSTHEPNCVTTIYPNLSEAVADLIEWERARHAKEGRAKSQLSPDRQAPPPAVADRLDLVGKPGAQTRGVEGHGTPTSKATAPAREDQGQAVRFDRGGVMS